MQFFDHMIGTVFGTNEVSEYAHFIIQSFLKMDIKLSIVIVFFLITITSICPIYTHGFRQTNHVTCGKSKSTQGSKATMIARVPLSPEANKTSFQYNARFKVSGSEPVHVMQKKIDEVSEEETDLTVVVENKERSKEGPKCTHFCFLVHGYNGQPADLQYLRRAMADVAGKRMESKSVCESESCVDRIVMHSCQSNWRRTGDGVENGGKRILKEILSIVRSHTIPAESDGDETFTNVTISMVGNSLGGLYSRYAIARFAELSEGKDEEFILLDGNIRAHFNIFCTTATPHLGVSGHTYVPLPRTAEIGIGKFMGETGRDLFRMSKLVKTMCTCPSYLKPLRSFRKRIAYANAYRTDFVVPTSTALFLNHESTYPHHVKGIESEDDGDFQNKSEMVIATLQTPQDNGDSRFGDKPEIKSRKRWPTLSRMLAGEHKEDLLEMSKRMDELGWKKVLVDVRKHMPVSVKIPRIVRKRSSVSSSQSDSDHSVNNSPEDSCPNLVLESRSVAHAFTDPEDVLAFPLGHNTLVAVEKHGLSSAVFQGGRPLMDGLAKEIVDEIITWNANSAAL